VDPNSRYFDLWEMQSQTVCNQFFPKFVTNLKPWVPISAVPPPLRFLPWRRGEVRASKAARRSSALTICSCSSPVDSNAVFIVPSTSVTCGQGGGLDGTIATLRATRADGLSGRRSVPHNKPSAGNAHLERLVRHAVGQLVQRPHRATGSPMKRPSPRGSLWGRQPSARSSPQTPGAGGPGWMRSSRVDSSPCSPAIAASAVRRLWGHRRGRRPSPWVG